MIVRPLAGLAAGCLLFSFPATAQTVSLVSVDSAGVQGNGDSRAPRISANGNWVVFKSDASNLVAGDSNGVGDVFVRDLTSGSTALVSFAPGGAPANGESFSPHVNADGSVIVFHSSATNLVPGDTNGRDDVFALVGGVIVRAASVQPNGHSREPIVSGDGRYVVFESLASNLVPSDTNGTWDIFRFDLQTATTVRLSVTSTGAEANGESHNAWVDADGSVVCFDSLATNLVSGDTNGSSDVFAHYLATGMVTSPTCNSQLLGNSHSDSICVSSSGEYFAFRSDASNLYSGDSNGCSDVFSAYRNSFTGAWLVGIASHTMPLGPANGPSFDPFIRGDGAWQLAYLFTSEASNLVTGDTNGTHDVFEANGSQITRISTDSYFHEVTGHSSVPSASDDGLRYAFRSLSSELVPSDANGMSDVFLRGPAPMTWFVDASSAWPGDGSPEFPFRDLQYAITRPEVVDGDTILVLPGVYVGAFTYHFKNLELRSTGGPALTILDGANANPVVRLQWPGGTLDGFTIRNGYAKFGDVWGNFVGGGIYAVGCQPIVRNCVISDNLADVAAGLYSDSGVILENCEIRNNYSSAGSSAVYSRGTSRIQACTIRDNIRGTSFGGSFSVGNCVTIVDAGASTLVQGCTFVNNRNDFTYSGPGGGLFLATWIGSPRVEGCLFEDNVGDSGGAVALEGSSAAIFEACIFRHNFLDDFTGVGGAIYTGGTPVVLDGCVFEDNRGFLGGAIFANQVSAVDCVFETNVGGKGGVLYSYGPGTASLVGCVLNGNNACETEGSPPSYGACFAGEVSVTLDRCSLFNNTAGGQWCSPGECGLGGFSVDAANSIVLQTSNEAVCAAIISATYSDTDLVSGVGTINQNPQFWDPEGGDLHLLPASPCIDTGDPLSSSDPDGSRADMGAFPFDPAYCGTPRVYCTAKTTSNGCTPSIAWTGSPHLTGGADDFFITASNVINNKNGLLFWGADDAAIPFQGGYLCVKPPIVRTGLKNSEGNPPPNDCSGTFSHHFSQAYMQAGLMQPGTVVHAQYWFRDPGFQPPNNVGLSDALRFVICQ